MQCPVVKAQQPNLLPTSPYKKRGGIGKSPHIALYGGDGKTPPSLPTNFRSFKSSLFQLPTALWLTACSSLTEPRLELGSILLELVKIQPPQGFYGLWRKR